MKLPQPKNPQKGFTLIELMIVIAIIAILVAIALPQLQTYLRKTTFSETFSVTSAPKANLTAFIQEKDGTLPSAAQANQYDKASGAFGANSAVDLLDVDITGTALTICAKSKSTLNKDIAGKTVMYTAVQETGESGNDSITYACTSDALQKYLPATCTSNGGATAIACATD